MKLIKSDGRHLTVWQIGDEPIFELHAGACPIKCHGYHILDNDAARDLVRELRAAQTEAVAMSTQPDAGIDILAQLAVSPIPPSCVADVAALLDFVAAAFPSDCARVRRLLANYTLNMYARHS
jgi:hypothetical protein